MQHYRFGDVIRYTGVTRSQLIHWTNVKVVRPGLADTAGTGHHRVFDFGNLVEIRVAVILAQYQLTVTSLAFLMQIIRPRLRGRARNKRHDSLLWIPAGSTKVSMAWQGTIAELASELPHLVGLTKRVGLVIDLGGVVADLEKATGDRL